MTCTWIFIVDYYETECSNSIEEEDYDNIVPEFCPYCGNKIAIDDII